ncbi:hypothetical protein LCGC14_1590010, partial [marine sediment metagenome]
MPNSLQSVTANLRGNRDVSPKRRSSGTAIMDTLTQGSITRGPNGVVQIIRSAIVTGLVGPPESKIPDALNAVGMPRYGDPHPSPIAAGLPLSIMRADIFESEPDKAIVTLTYQFPTATGGITLFENEPSETTAPQIEVTTTLNQLTTNRNVDGNTITVTYVAPIIDPDTGDIIGSRPITQGGEVTIMVPTTTRNYMRREPRDPGDKAQIYVGTTNSTPVFGDPAGFWLCTGLGGPSDDGGITYNVTYSFQRGEPHRVGGESFAGWQAVVVYIDPETGKPPGDLLSNRDGT